MVKPSFELGGVNRSPRPDPCLSMPAVGRRRTQHPDGDDNPQPSIGALGSASLPHYLDRLAHLRDGIIAMLRGPLVSGAVDVEIGGRHAAMVMAKPGKSSAPQHWGEAERGSGLGAEFQRRSRALKTVGMMAWCQNTRAALLNKMPNSLASSKPMAKASYRRRADEREPSELSRASLCFSISEAQASISLANLATSAEIAGSRAAAIARKRAALARRYAIGLRLALMGADCDAKALIYPKSSRSYHPQFQGGQGSAPPLPRGLHP